MTGGFQEGHWPSWRRFPPTHPPGQIPVDNVALTVTMGRRCTTATAYAATTWDGWRSS
jgi:hypothetical protein